MKLIKSFKDKFASMVEIMLWGSELERLRRAKNYQKKIHETQKT